MTLMSCNTVAYCAYDGVSAKPLNYERNKMSRSPFTTKELALLPRNAYAYRNRYGVYSSSELSIAMKNQAFYTASLVHVDLLKMMRTFIAQKSKWLAN